MDVDSPFVAGGKSAEAIEAGKWSLDDASRHARAMQVMPDQRRAPEPLRLAEGRPAWQSILDYSSFEAPAVARYVFGSNPCARRNAREKLLRLLKPTARATWSMVRACVSSNLAAWRMRISRNASIGGWPKACWKR